MKKTGVKIFISIVVIALIAGAIFGIYKLGYSKGVLSNISTEELTAAHENLMATSPMSDKVSRGFAHPGMRNSMHGRFGIARIFGGLFFLFIIGGIFRMIRMNRYMRCALISKHTGKGLENDHPWNHGSFCGHFWGKDRPEKETTSEDESSEENSVE